MARTPPESLEQRIDALDAWLPQTQCAACGYPGCRDYARALARGQTGPNRCPPGGAATLGALARLLGVPETPLDPECGPPRARRLARIDESLCIGCTKCIQACPVDAIFGAARLMHTVIAAECTGCELCLPPCPMDCIRLIPWPGEAEPASPWPEYPREQVERARRRAAARRRRLGTRPGTPEQAGTRTDKARIRAEIRAAVARARARRQRPGAGG